MQTTTQIIITQMEMFATMIVVGYIFYKSKLISDDAVKGFHVVLTRFIIPCMLLTLMPNGGTLEEMKRSGKFIIISFGYIFFMMFLSIFTSALLFKKNKKRKHMHVLCSTLGNAGFIGSPLCATLYPTQGVANALYVMIEALFCWIAGPFIGDEKMQFKKESLKNLKTPIMAAIFVGCIMTILNIHPSGLVPWDTISMIGSFTKYMATFYIGLSLGQVGLGSLFRDPRIFVSSLMKLIITPIIFYIFLTRFNLASGDELGLFLIMASTPTGMATPMVADLCSGDKEYAVAGTMINTLLCLFTIPFVSYLTTML